MVLVALVGPGRMGIDRQKSGKSGNRLDGDGKGCLGRVGDRRGGLGRVGDRWEGLGIDAYGWGW